MYQGEAPHGGPCRYGGPEENAAWIGAVAIWGFDTEVMEKAIQGIPIRHGVWEREATKIVLRRGVFSRGAE